MKQRRGFVTNSSSTNDIFVALGTAGAAAALGTVINTIQVSKNTEIVSYAILDTLHQPEEPRPPEIRVNDSEYVAWFYSGVRIIDVQYAFDEESQETQITVLRDEYDSGYTSQIKYSIPETYIEKWLTFATSGEDIATMSGDYKVCGFMCESWENDKPRRQRQGIAGKMSFDVSVDVAGKPLYKGKQVNIKNESDLYASDGYALNDANITTTIPIRLINPDKYKWKLSYEVSKSDLEKYAHVELRHNKDESKPSVLIYDLIIKPHGKPLGSKENPLNSIIARLDIKGEPSSDHISDVWDYLELTLIDEGILFEGKLDKESRLEVVSYCEESSESTEPSKEIPPTPFTLKCVIKVESEGESSTAQFVDMSEAEISFKPLLGTDDATNNLVKAYEYEIKFDGHAGYYHFEPKMHLPTSKTPYVVKLPVECSVKNKTYHLDLPIQLIGEPYGNKQAWEDEYRKLRIIIRKYIPAEQWIDILRNIEDNKNRLSIEQLRLMRRSIYETARDQLTAEAQGYQSIANICEWTEWGLEGVKWLGDQAFSYLMAVYTGPVGEAFIVPFKDVLTMVVADEVTEYIWGGAGAYSEDQIARGSLSAIFTSFENAINIGADDMVGAKSLSIKQLGRYLAAFATIKCLNHYFNDVKDDGSPIGFWDAIVETCKDLSINFFKNIVAKKFEAMMKSDKAGELFEKYVSKQFKEKLLKVIPDWDKVGISDPRSLEILGKYLSEFAGFVSCSAYGKTVSVASTTEIISDPNDTIISFNLSSDENNPWIVKISLNKVKDSLSDYIFNSMFSSFPFASAPISPSDDPTFYKA
jgi:hypothetical protein